jgi:hypothetical protein
MNDLACRELYHFARRRNLRIDRQARAVTWAPPVECIDYLQTDEAEPQSIALAHVSYSQLGRVLEWARARQFGVAQFSSWYPERVAVLLAKPGFSFRSNPAPENREQRCSISLR